MIEPNYAENVIVGIILNKDLKWFITHKDLWFMDLEKLNEAYSKMGYPVNDLSNERFGIKVLSEINAEEFIKKIGNSQISSKELNNRVTELAREDDFIKLEEYVPSILIDFDKKKLISMYPENISFEEYVPEGWKGEYEDFLEQIPSEYKYWMCDNNNLFEEYL